MNLTAKVQAHDSEIEMLKKQVAALRKDLHAEALLPPKAPFEAWVESDEAAKFGGKHVAWINEEGVIADGDGIGAVIAAIKGHPRRKDIILGFVASAGS